MDSLASILSSVNICEVDQKTVNYWENFFLKFCQLFRNQFIYYKTVCSALWSIENAENKKINCDIRPIESNKGSAFSKAINLFQTILGALRTNLIPFITAKNLIFVEISKFSTFQKFVQSLKLIMSMSMSHVYIESIQSKRSYRFSVPCHHVFTEFKYLNPILRYCYF